MLLDDNEILHGVTEGAVGVDPFVPDNVQAASIDLRLDRFFEVLTTNWWTRLLGVLGHPGGTLSPRRDSRPHFRRVELPEHGKPLVLRPGGCVLAATRERVTVPAFMGASVDGKSSTGRLFTICHTTAGWIDPGFSGHITLEVVNLSPLPVELWPGDKICQLKFHQMHGAAARPYGTAGNHYQHQERGPVLSRSHVKAVPGLPPIRGEVAA